jgi:lactate dehydrogenase-like 2-hydroxyacid dehydrogenase
MPDMTPTVRFINRERLAQTNNRSWLVNTARGAVLDEAALLESLTSGRIAGSAHGCGEPGCDEDA